jgi:hypothetical protein
MLDIVGYTRSGRVEQNRIREGLLLKNFSFQDPNTELFKTGNPLYFIL